MIQLLSTVLLLVGFCGQNLLASLPSCSLDRLDEKSYGAVFQDSPKVPYVLFSGNNNTTTNRYQVVVGEGESKTCQWDANGCLTEIRTPQLLKQFEWDARNLLVKRIVTDLANPTHPVKTTEIVRDGLSRFVRITEKEGAAVISDIRLVWDGFKIVEARDANSGNVLIRFFDLGMEIVSGPNAGIYFYTFDHLGSIREVIRATTGQVVVRNEYDFWGRLTRVMGTLPLSFTFHGMYDLGDNTYLTLYRPYFAELAKWGSPDPLGEQADLDLTRFVRNDPVNYVDRLGLWAYFQPSTWFNRKGYQPGPIENDIGISAQATLDGIIPFGDPFGNNGGYDKCSKLNQFSQEMGAFSRDSYLLARIPNLGKYVKNPGLYEKGSKMVPGRVWNQIKNIDVIQRGEWLSKNSSAFENFGEFSQALKATWNTGLTPGGRIGTLLLGSGTDALMRNTSSKDCECK